MYKRQILYRVLTLCQFGNTSTRFKESLRKLKMSWILSEGANITGMCLATADRPCTEGVNLVFQADEYINCFILFFLMWVPFYVKIWLISLFLVSVTRHRGSLRIRGVIQRRSYFKVRTPIRRRSAFKISVTPPSGWFVFVSHRIYYDILYRIFFTTVCNGSWKPVSYTHL